MLKKSIKQFNLDGCLKRAVNLSEIMKNLNFKGKFKNYEFNFRNTVKETENMIQTAKLNREALITKNKLGIKHEFLKTARCNNKFFSQRIMEVRHNHGINSNALT